MSLSQLQGSETTKKLLIGMEKKETLACVGLDPDVTKIPSEVMLSEGNIEDKVFTFLSSVIEITSPHVCAYKIQKAFFDQFEQGHLLLKKVILYIHQKYPETPVFLDCKIGDTGNTMDIYMKTIFDDMSVDGVVINPYMGDDVFDPFCSDSKKVGIVLVQTSNPKAVVVQDLQLQNGKKLWEEILELVITRWNMNHNLIPVLSSNTTHDYTAIRRVIPDDMPILLAGVGQQGGNTQVLKQLLNKKGYGVFVNSSRGILYPYAPSDKNWKERILRAILNLKKELNDIRNSSCGNTRGDE